MTIEVRTIEGPAPTLVFLHEGLGCVSMWRVFPDRVAHAVGRGAMVLRQRQLRHHRPVSDLPHHARRHGRTRCRRAGHHGDSLRCAGRRSARSRYHAVPLELEARVTRRPDVLHGPIRSVRAFARAARRPTPSTPTLATHRATYGVDGALATIASPAIASSTAVTSYSWDADGALQSVLRPDGKSLSYAYEPSGALSAVTYDTTSKVGVTYDAAGRVAVLSNAAGKITYSYDGPLVTAETWTGSFTATAQRYYETGLRLGRENVLGSPFSFGGEYFSYDGDGLITKTGTMTLTRDALTGRLASSTLGSVQEAWTWPSYGEPATQSVKYGTTELLATSWEYDALGRVTTAKESSGGSTAVWEYAYDPRGRLVEVKKDGVVVGSYGWDANGNRTSVGATTATIDSRDRILTQGGYTYVHGEAGEWLSRTEVATGKKTSFGWTRSATSRP